MARFERLTQFTDHRSPLLAALVVAAVTATVHPGNAAELRSGYAADVPHRADLRDLGRVPATMPVHVAVVLNYRHEGELATLVRLQSDPRSRVFHHFLTSRQFNDYFAPSRSDYGRAQQALERAGFRIEGTAGNRTLVDAGAPALVAERYFQTELHRVAQAGAGVRYANVKPALMPAELRGLVGSVAGLNDLVVAHPFYRFADAAQRQAALARAAVVAQVTGGRRESADRLHAPAIKRLPAIKPYGANIIADPGFESGGYRFWQQCGNVNARVTSRRAHTGTYSELAGTTSGGEVNGDAGLCQQVTVPANGVLSFWVYQGSNEPNNVYAWQWALFMDAGGNVIDSLYQTVNNTGGWKQLSFNVASLAGQTLYLYFGVHGDGYYAYHTYQYVDDVSLTGGAPTPTPVPTATPTAAPTATPTPKPSATPTPGGTPTPTAAPTATPVATATPTAVPTATPTPKPTATPTGGGGQPIGGPLNGPDGGYGPLAVANGYDLPVQHGFNGSGHTAGVVIWADYLASDLTAYESEWGITRTGTTSKVAVDGGATFNGNINDPSNASVETELDVETIEGNSPGANIIVYEFPQATDQDIEDAYNRAVSDNFADVLNSSFGGCESSDTSFATATNQIATQGAAKGITFSASSGDSGSNECSGSQGVSAPAGGPEFMSIGGTSLQVTSNGTWSSEVVWNSNGGAGGGGVSTFFALPSYQQGIGGVIASGRNQPDISLSADPSFGTSLYFNGAWVGPIGGTSWASPIFTAYLAQVAQIHGARAGFVNPSIYSTFSGTGYTYFHDITSGNNFGYSAKTGYDQASGIGSIKSGNALAGQLP